MGASSNLLLSLLLSVILFSGVIAVQPLAFADDDDEEDNGDDDNGDDNGDELNSGDTIVYDAIRVISSEEEIAFQESIPEPEVEQLKSRYVPIWFKNNAHWWSQEMIEDSDFVAGIEYLIQKEIITISESGNVAANSSDEIPTWIKNNAGWWSEDLITEQVFIDGLQWLISIGVISVGETR